MTKKTWTKSSNHSPLRYGRSPTKSRSRSQISDGRSPKSRSRSPLSDGRSPKRKHASDVPMRQPIGGKATFRHRNQLGNDTHATAKFFSAHITRIYVVSNSSFYGTFYRLDYTGQTAIATVNIANNPSTYFVQQLGCKMVLISPHEEKPWVSLDRQKHTTTAADFRTEALVQYKVFKETSLKGANALTPGIVHAEIFDRRHAFSCLEHSKTFGDKDVVATMDAFRNALTRDPSLKLGVIWMDFIPASQTIGSEIAASTNQMRKDALANWHRWALLRTAVTSGIFHQDLHQFNALCNDEFGFIRDVDVQGRDVSVNGSIQLIDWGRAFQDADLFSDVKNLWKLYIGYAADARYAEWFTADFLDSKRKAITAAASVLSKCDAQIAQIFTDWLTKGRMNGPAYYMWVIQTPRIDSHTIMYFEARYLRNRRLVSPRTFSDVIVSDDMMQRTLDALVY